MLESGSAPGVVLGTSCLWQPQHTMHVANTTRSRSRRVICSSPCENSAKPLAKFAKYANNAKANGGLGELGERLQLARRLETTRRGQRSRPTDVSPQRELGVCVAKRDRAAERRHIRRLPSRSPASGRCVAAPRLWLWGRRKPRDASRHLCRSATFATRTDRG